MREIKFRAWVKNGLPFGKSGLREVSSISFNHCVYVVIDEKDSPGKDQNYWQVMKEDYILLQYTGLKDKNGKEIYEGDIVSGKQYSKKVVYNEERTTFMLLFYYENRWLRDNLSEEVSTGAEVIGNIYENKELLEGK